MNSLVSILPWTLASTATSKDPMGDEAMPTAKEIHLWSPSHRCPYDPQIEPAVAPNRKNLCPHH
eukprot:11574171-Karenia_brevis.AAC.1